MLATYFFCKRRNKDFINEYSQTAVSSEGAKSTYIGAAVYPTLALFNHSCDPAIVRYYVEDYVVVQVHGLVYVNFYLPVYSYMYAP